MTNPHQGAGAQAPGIEGAGNPDQGAPPPPALPLPPVPDSETLRNEIPSAMQTARRWLVWRLVPHKDPTKKPRKVPFYLDGAPRNGALDTPADLARLGTLDDALKVLATGRYTGLGFALGQDGPACWQGIDLDHTDTRPELAALVGTLPGYVERSPSGAGVHAVGYGPAVPAMGSNRSGIETYCSGRYFTVTGDAIRGDLADLSGFIVATLAPLHAAGSGRGGRDAQGAPDGHGPTIQTDADTARDLRSALASLRSDDRGLWVKMGLALKSLGDIGRALWVEWSQGSDKYNAADAARVWKSFKPSSTGPAAVFAEAQRGGWVNPKKGVSRETPAPTAPVAPVAPASPIAPVVPIASRRPVQAAPATAKPDQWPEPDDLSSSIAAAPYPVDAFPEPARSAVIEYHRFGRQPLSLVGSSALGQMALAAQALADVGRDERLISPISLNLMVTAESGERKSAADKQFGRAGRQWQREEREARLSEWRRAGAMERDWRARIDGVKKKITGLAGKDSADNDTALTALRERLIELEQNPIIAKPLPLLTYEDVTPAALAYTLGTGWPSAGLFSDEGGAVVGSHGLGEDTATGFLSLLNILWDGRDYVPTRKQALTVELRGRRFSAFLMVQPDLLPKLIEKGARNIGFIARFLLSAPLSTMGTRLYVEPPPDWHALNDYDEVIKRLLNSEMPIDTTQSDRGYLMRLKPPVMLLDPAAKRDWIDYHDGVERELHQFGDFAGVKDVASKSAENAARIAAVFKVFDQGGPSRAVEARYMRAGIQVAAWHLSEARRLFFEVDAPPDVTDARELSTWLCTKARELADPNGEPIVTPAGEIAVRHLAQYGPNRVRDLLRRDAAIESLEDSGHVRRHDVGKQKRLKINPKLLNQQ